MNKRDHYMPGPAAGAEAPTRFEYRWGDNDVRWGLESLDTGTRLTFRHNVEFDWPRLRAEYSKRFGI